MSACVRLWLDDPRVGCGEREFLVVAEGRTYATLLYIPTLATVRVPLNEVKRGRPVAIAPKKLLRSIRRLKRDREHLGLPYSKAGTNAALALLNGEAT